MVVRQRRRVAKRTPRKSTKGVRTCVGCRESFPQPELLRFVSSPEGELFVDLHMKAPGRGAYVCYSPGCLEKGIRSKGFSRALKRQLVRVDVANLTERILEGIDSRLLDLLCLARRAGCVRSGMDTLERSKSRVLLWVLASDVAKGSRSSVERWSAATQTPVYTFGTAEELGRTQSAPQRVCLGFVVHQVTDRIKVEFGRRCHVLVAGQDEKPIEDANALEHESKAKVK